MTDPRRLAFLAVAVVMAMLLAGFVGLATARGSAAAPATPTAGSAAAAASPSAPSSTPASCPTPDTSPDWNSANFFADILVTVQVPGDPALDGSNFNTVPCQNDLPTYLSYFWLNISTNVPITEAYVTIWGTSYPTGSNIPLGDFDPAAPRVEPMYQPTPGSSTASFYFNLYRFFYPGSTVYFNVTVESQFEVPSTISSTASSFSTELPLGSGDNATWQFYVEAPWWSTTFLSDISVFTNPSLLGGYPYDPNPTQGISVGIESIGPTGAPGTPIPQALLTFTLTGQYAGTYSEPFGPRNATWENITPAVGTVIGPYPGSTMTFNITIWLPWEGSDIDVLTSPLYEFTWSTKGGWWAPSQGLTANANLTSTPWVLASNVTALATGTPVNVTVHTPIPNVTIASSIVRFTFTDPAGSLAGTLPMTPLTQNTTFGVIPGLPAGSNLTFSVLAKDAFGVPVASGNYTYSESGPPAATADADTSWIYVEAVNVTTDQLIPDIPFTIANATWSGSGTVGPLGFGIPLAASGAGVRLLDFGTYTVSVTVFGHTETTSVVLNATSGPLAVPFWFASGAVHETATVPVTGVLAALVVGPVVATAALYPLLLWYRERQRKAAEEQRRITL